MIDLPPLGLVLLTGGKGQRLGGTKHDRPHPRGGSWGGHVLGVFRQVAPSGPVVLLGSGLPDHPELVPFEDPRQGPAVALRTWAASQPCPVGRWWVVACDQLKWTASGLQTWWEEAERADPKGRAWVVAHTAGQIQPLGGFFGGELMPLLAQAEGSSLRNLMQCLPVIAREGPVASGLDIDTPEDLSAWGE
jgi:molybdopterin-guanine dinucleotide biosynthesis protein A